MRSVSAQPIARNHVVFACSLAVLVIATALIVLPFANHPLRPQPLVFPITYTTIFVLMVTQINVLPALMALILHALPPEPESCLDPDVGRIDDEAASLVTSFLLGACRPAAVDAAGDCGLASTRAYPGVGTSTHWRC
jgi:hypothetical protein